MARKLTAGERKHPAEKAIRLSISGWSNQKISENLGINPRTVAGLLKELKPELVPDAAVALAEAISRQAGHQPPSRDGGRPCPTHRGHPARAAPAVGGLTARTQKASEADGWCEESLR